MDQRPTGYRPPVNDPGTLTSVPPLLPCDLVHVSDRDPGIHRRGVRRFHYVDAHGRRVGDHATLERIASLAIPPAWTDVWICADPNGHLQATGRDQRGRKQGRYHPTFRSEREDVKFAQLVEFAHALSPIRRAVRLDLAGREPTLRRQTALVVQLLDLTAVRVGNEQYARANRSFGLTTLRTRQVRVSGAEVTFEFVGKSGRRHHIDLHDRHLARLIRQCQDLPGQRLFTFVDERGEPHTVCSQHVNDYVRQVSGAGFTAKTFRTWTATAAAAAFLAADRRPPTKRGLLAGIDRAADLLGNTRSVCRASYVHPAIQERYLDGTLTDLWRSGPVRASAALTLSERRTLHVLTTHAADAMGAPARAA
jgi:DNA topoisomerase-1